MKDLGLDFGLLIAYLVPGAVTLVALESRAPDLLLVGGSTGAVRATLWAVSALIAGMVVSLVRGSILDASFAINLHRVGLARSRPHYGSCRRVEVDYAVLAKAEAVDAFREATLQDKRPYQFYGNTLVATAFWALSHQDLTWKAWLVLMVIWVLLYIGARRSHFVYMDSVKALNGLGLTAQGALVLEGESGDCGGSVARVVEGG